MINLLHRSTKKLISTDQPQLFSHTEWIFDPDLTGVAGVPVYYWHIERNSIREMTAEEKVAYDATTLPTMKAAKEAKLTVEVRDSIYVRYPIHNQISLSVILTLALAQQKMARFAYIASGAAWIDKCFTYYYAKCAEIRAATTMPELDAITWDVVSLWEEDPQVTIEHARTIDA